jgi:hypothetical protein
LTIIHIAGLAIILRQSTIAAWMVKPRLTQHFSRQRQSTDSYYPKNGCERVVTGGSQFVRKSLRLLRSFTLRVNTSGCCAAGQTTQNDGLPHGEPCGNRRI